MNSDDALAKLKIAVDALESLHGQPCHRNHTAACCVALGQYQEVIENALQRIDNVGRPLKDQLGESP